MQPFGRVFYILLKKTTSALLTLVLVVTATFFIMRSIPGTIYSGEVGLSPAIVKNIRAKYHLDESLLRQYAGVLIGVARFDFGDSMVYEGRKVGDIIARQLPVSAVLGAVVALISVLAGVASGVYIFRLRNKFLKKFLSFVMLLGLAMPSFVIAALLQYFFSVRHKVFPVIAGTNIFGYFLPVIALAAYPTAVIAKMINDGISEAMRKGYVIGARARGLPEKRIIYVHALKNAILPVLSYVGPMLATLLVGSFAIETIFSVPGLGRYYILSVSARDYTTVMGITVFYAMILVFINLVMDVIVGLIDPRTNKD